MGSCLGKINTSASTVAVLDFVKHSTQHIYIINNIKNIGFFTEYLQEELCVDAF